MKYAFLLELIQRLKTDKPAFFAKIQIIAIFLVVIGGGIETLVMMDVIHLAEKIQLAIGGLVAFLLGSGIVAQLPKKDAGQK